MNPGIPAPVSVRELRASLVFVVGLGAQTEGDLGKKTSVAPSWGETLKC